MVALPTKTLDGRLVYEKRTVAKRPKLTKVITASHMARTCRGGAVLAVN